MFISIKAKASLYARLGFPCISLLFIAMIKYGPYATWGGKGLFTHQECQSRIGLKPGGRRLGAYWPALPAFLYTPGLLAPPSTMS